MQEEGRAWRERVRRLEDELAESSQVRFTCFTGTLYLLEERVRRFGGGARRYALLAFLSLLALLVLMYKGVAGARAAVGGGARGELARTRVTCFTSATVQILTRPYFSSTKV